MPAQSNPFNNYIPSLIRLAMPFLFVSSFENFFTFWRYRYSYEFIYIFCFYTLTALLILGFKSRFFCLFAGLTILILRFFTARWPFFSFIQHHHSTLMAVICIALFFAPSGLYFSIDKKLNPQMKYFDDKSARFIIKSALSSLYFFSALDKFSWIKEEYLLALLTKHTWGSLNVPAWGPQLCILATIAALGFEFACALGVWSEKWSSRLVIPVVVFHVLLPILLPVSAVTMVVLVMWLWILPKELLDKILE